MFEKAKWIWCRKCSEIDSYAEFYTTCELDGFSAVRIRISADSNYALYVNGVFVDSGQYADMPHYKIYDDVDISNYIVPGTNHIAIVVWHYGVTSFSYYIGKPGVIFEIARDTEVVCSSDESVQVRTSKRYRSGRNRHITTQLGLDFYVDLKEDERWFTGQDRDAFEAAILQNDMPTNLLPRENKKLQIKPRISTQMVQQGSFTYLPESEHAGDMMQHAALSFYRLYETGETSEDCITLKRQSGEGIYFVMDLQEETAGYVDFDIEVDKDCEMEIGWGEHLYDGRCRTHIAERNFSVRASLKSGRNSYMNPFRRLGCRYVQFFIHADNVKVYYAGLRPTEYPVTIKPYESGNLLRDTIYKVCCNTLLQCMHEHYEDCPWREQAYYSLDSRNQMLCGYYAFEEREMPKSALKLSAMSLRDDGLLPMVYPTNERLAIPSFMLAYMMQVAEYYRDTKDKETVEFCFDTAKTVMDTFITRIDETGLIPNFEEAKKYWNFYEWQPYLNGRNNCGIKVYDMCLNAFLSLTLDYFVEICNIMEADASGYLKVKKELNQAIVKEFYNDKEQLFDTYRGQNEAVYSVLANALGCLCGAADNLERSRMLQIIEDNLYEGEDIKVIPATLSMHTYRYDALLKENQARYKEVILTEIDRVYFKMLREGATSFWETEKGDKDFSHAGSLCHGWSAMPIYYYKTLCGDEV